MKYFYGVLLGVMCLVGVCAADDQQNHNNLPEKSASSRELDKQINILAKQIISRLDAQKTRKIAVIEFTGLEGNVPSLGKYLAEELTTRLFLTGRFRIIERQLMKNMMEEQKLSASGLIDAKTASKFGQILGVDALMTGTIADLNTSVKINARLIAVETGSVFAVASVKVPINKEVELLLGKRPGEAARSDPRRFDGDWNTNIACAPLRGGQSYHIHLKARVKEGVFHGQQGTDGIGPFLTLDWKINLDGSAYISANGLTGDPKYTIGGKFPKNSPYTYHIDANFSDFRATDSAVNPFERWTAQPVTSKNCYSGNRLQLKIDCVKNSFLNDC
jgi:curli biogenesis system outer membrane secretion channel CsgG